MILKQLSFKNSQCPGPVLELHDTTIKEIVIYPFFILRSTARSWFTHSSLLVEDASCRADETDKARKATAKTTNWSYMYFDQGLKQPPNRFQRGINDRRTFMTIFSDKQIRFEGENPHLMSTPGKYTKNLKQ